MRGSVFKRGRTWTAQVYLGRDAVTGRKRYRQLGGFGTKRAAEQALTEQLERLRVGEYVDAGATTVAGFVERWLTAVEPSLRPTTFASYRNMLGLHVVPRLGKVRLVKLTGLDLSGLYGELLASGYRKGNTTRGLSPTTVKYIHQIVRKALADAVRWGLLVRNPAAQVDPPRRSDQEMATWSAPQARRFIEAVADDRLRAMWVLLCSTGMRRGEVLGLRWDDVDLDAGRIAVQRALVEVSGYDLRLSDPKSARGKRSVRLDAHTTAELVCHRRRQLEERMAYGNHHVYVSLAERLERLRRTSLERAEASVEFLREILELAKQVTAAEKMEEDGGAAALSLLPDPKVGALTQILNEYGPKDTPVIVEEVVADIDAIVRQVRFVGWADTQNGDREVRKEIRLVLKRYALPTTGELFDRTYAYIRENY